MLTTRTAHARPARAWIDRLTPAVTSLVVVGLGLGIAASVETDTPIALLGVIVGGVALLGLLASARRRSPAERPWAASGRSTSTGPKSARQLRPEPVASDRASERTAAGPRPPSGRRVVAALGRFEARELACSPWFAVGVGFQLWILATFAVQYGAEDNNLWAEVILQLLALCHPLVGMTVIAAHAATTRGCHDAAEELYASCPAGATPRTLATMSTAWVPAVAVATFLAAYLGLLGLLHDQVYGPAGPDAIADLLASVTLGVGGVVLGVTVGRWVRSRLAPLVAVVAVGAISLRMGADGGGWTKSAQLSTFVPVDPEVFRPRAAWWYLAWLLGLTAVVAALALARSRGDQGPRAKGTGRAALAVGVLGVTVAVVAGLMTTRPLPASTAELLADRVGHPAAHQVCVPAGSAARVCGYRGYGELRDRVAIEVAPVAAALPSGAAPVTLRQVFSATPADLPPEVARGVPAGTRLPPGEVGMPLKAVADRVVATRFLVALSFVGLPVEPGRSGSEPRPLVVAGQARGVVALWLAARGLGAEAAAHVATAQRRGQRGPTPATADAFDRGFAWPTSCQEAPVVWSAQDLAAARTLLAQPTDVVTATVHAGWARWRDPATGTDELMASLGLGAAGPFDPVVTRDPGGC